MTEENTVIPLSALTAFIEKTSKVVSETDRKAFHEGAAACFEYYKPFKTYKYPITATSCITVKNPYGYTNPRQEEAWKDGFTTFSIHAHKKYFEPISKYKTYKEKCSSKETHESNFSPDNGVTVECDQADDIVLDLKYEIKNTYRKLKNTQFCCVCLLVVIILLVITIISMQ